MSILFEPFKIGRLELRNRFIRSATTSAWSEPNGVLRPEIIGLYERLAEGEVGLIVKGHLYVMEPGKAYIGQAGIDSEAQLLMLKRLTETVHAHGGVISAQLNHAGINSAIDRAGPSEYDGPTQSLERVRARALTSEEVWGIVEAFGDGADRAMEVGFDCVQIHGAHGWLISQFLSRSLNRRNDEWGGDLKRRMRLLMEVYDEIRGRVGRGTPVLLKMNCDDFSPEGFTIDDSTRVAEAVCRRGLDLLEVSGGSYIDQRPELRERARLKDDSVLSEAHFAGYALEIRKVVGETLTSIVGGVRSLACMRAIVERGVADMVSMSRPFIREQDLVKKLREGQCRAACISCDLHREIMRKTMLHCPVEERSG